MPKPPKPSDDEDRPKRFRITRKRLGQIRFVDPKGEFGFIEAEDFRDDVFFHRSSWQPVPVETNGPLSSKTLSSNTQSSEAPASEAQTEPDPVKDDDDSPYGKRPGFQRNSGRRNSGQRDFENQRPPKLVPEDLVMKVVEFEIDDELWESEQNLRATVVRPTKRPMGRQLSGRDATFKIVTHHPKARRKRPDWRG